MTSLWNSVTKKTTNFSSLKGNIKADIVIIGAGMAGILTAYLLQKKGYSCVILEAAKIGEGQTHHTTAKLTVQHGDVYKRQDLYHSREQCNNKLFLRTIKIIIRSISQG